jgi:hypothetical protein
MSIGFFVQLTATWKPFTAPLPKPSPKRSPWQKPDLEWSDLAAEEWFPGSDLRNLLTLRWLTFAEGPLEELSVLRFSRGRFRSSRDYVDHLVLCHRLRSRVSQGCTIARSLTRHGTSALQSLRDPCCAKECNGSRSKHKILISAPVSTLRRHHG